MTAAIARGTCTQRQVQHPNGTFPKCPSCCREPRHIFDGRSRPTGGHLLSCACGDTPKAVNLPEALNTWCRAHDVAVPVFAPQDAKVAQIRARSAR
jgi:hypothetical protein